jgi:hypothetical protein
METGEAQHNRVQQLILQEREEPNFDSAGDPFLILLLTFFFLLLVDTQHKTLSIR